MDGDIAGKARVFISSGQIEGPERDIANQVRDELERIGFEPYLAVNEQSLGAINDNIFRRLVDAEYFIFIDFKREKLEDGSYRGSLFSHQELAIATFLGKDPLIFQEQGVRSDDGILKAIQGNAFEFSDRNLLSDAIPNRVRKRGWTATWRDELVIERHENEYLDTIQYSHNITAVMAYAMEHPDDLGKKTRWYHLEIRNYHDRKIAFNCVVYLESYRNVEKDDEPTPVPAIELKWAYVRAPSVMIPPRSSRSVDAFHVYPNDPSEIFLGINTFLTDYETKSQHTLKGPGKFEVNFIVHSSDFPSVRDTLLLEIGTKLDDIKFHKKQHAHKLDKSS
jgi:hypothetical protein